MRQTSTRPIASWVSCRLWCDTWLAKNQIWSVSGHLNFIIFGFVKTHSAPQFLSRCAFFFVFCLLCLGRWCAAVATNAVWCCGHSSYGSLLDCSHAQHIRVNISTQTQWQRSFYIITQYCFYKLLLCLSLSNLPHSYCLYFSMDEGIETAFLGTRSGLMRFQRYTGIEKRTAK